MSQLVYSIFNLIWRFANTLLWFALWLFALAVVGLYLVRWWSGDHLLPARLMSYFMPWLLLGLLIALALAGLGRQGRLLLALAVPTFLLAVPFIPLFIPRFSPAFAHSETIKVMSYNLLYHNPNLGTAVDLIRREQPDILLLQEVTPVTARLLQARLSDIYPDDERHFTYAVHLTQAIFSKHPLEAGPTSYLTGRLQTARVETAAGSIAVWNVHPRAPSVWAEHRRQIANLAAQIGQVEGPLIVGGDFNTTEQSETYQMIGRTLNNAHREAGWGFGFTFPANGPTVKGLPILTPLVRIDHIFASPHFYVRQARTLTGAGGSDHRPVLAELALIGSEMGQNPVPAPSGK